MKTMKKGILIVLILVVLLWAIQLLICDVLTLKYASFIDAC